MSVPLGFRELGKTGKYCYRQLTAAPPRWENAGPRHQASCLSRAPVSASHTITEEQSLQYSEAITRELRGALGVDYATISFSEAVTKSLGIKWTRGRADQQNVTVPAMKCFDIFAEPWECRQHYEVEIYKDNSSFFFRGGWQPLETIRYYKVIGIKWKYTYEYNLTCCPISCDTGPVTGTLYSDVTGEKMSGEVWVSPVMDDITIMVPLRRDKDGNIIPPESLIPDELARQLKSIWRDTVMNTTRALIRRGVPVSDRLLDSRWRQNWKELDRLLSSPKSAEEIVRLPGAFLRF